MKRLIRKASKSLYHGTNYQGLIGITNSQSIIPNASEGAGPARGRESNYYGFSFLATTKEKAFTYTKDIAIDQLKAIIEVQVSEELLLPDDVDCPACKTWQESSDKVNQVKVEGEITSNFIKSIYLYNPISDEFVIETNLNNWQKDFEENAELFVNSNKNSDIADKMEEKGINVYNLSFSNNSDAIAAYNESLIDYANVITQIDNTINKLYGCIDEDGEIKISHYKELLDISHNETKFEYDISTSTATIIEIDNFYAETTFENVFKNVLIVFEGKTYNSNEFSELME